MSDILQLITIPLSMWALRTFSAARHAPIRLFSLLPPTLTFGMLILKYRIIVTSIMAQIPSSALFTTPKISKMQVPGL